MQIHNPDICPVCKARAKEEDRTLNIIVNIIVVIAVVFIISIGYFLYKTI